MYVCMYHTYIYIYVYMYVCKCVCIYIFVCVYNVLIRPCLFLMSPANCGRAVVHRNAWRHAFVHPQHWTPPSNAVALLATGAASARQ